MLYLLIGATLMIITKSQSCDSDGDCTGTFKPVCNFQGSGTIHWCTHCQQDLDCRSNTHYYGLGQVVCIVDNLGYGTCAECEYDYDCATGETCNLSNVCKSSSTGGDTDEDECSTNSDCVTLYGSGAVCKSSTTNYCLRDAKICSTDSDCIAQICTDHNGYYNYCADIPCNGDSACSLLLGDDDTSVCSSQSITSFGSCYQGCSSDSDCGVTNYECNTSTGQCAYITGSSTSTSTSSSGIDQLTVFMAMVTAVIGYALLV